MAKVVVELTLEEANIFLSDTPINKMTGCQACDERVEQAIRTKRRSLSKIARAVDKAMKEGEDG